MDARLERQLFEKFPALYRGREESSMEHGFECGDGWFDLIFRLSGDIESVANKAGIPMDSPEWPQCRQAKHKFGELRFVVFAKDGYRDAYERIAQLRNAAIEASKCICEECGLDKNSGEGGCKACCHH